MRQLKSSRRLNSKHLHSGSAILLRHVEAFSIHEGGTFPKCLCPVPGMLDGQPRKADASRQVDC